MANVVKTYEYNDGDRIAVVHLTNASDGTAETAVTKVDVSTLFNGPESVKISQIWYSTVGMSVNLLWDATADELVWTIPADSEGHLDFRCFGGINNKAGAGVTGDINLTTVGHSAGDTYSIILELAKS